MTKTIGITAINFYQILVSPFIKIITGTTRSCRFSETCSSYAKRQIEENGLVRGSARGLVRILRCQPYFNF